MHLSLKKKGFEVGCVVLATQHNIDLIAVIVFLDCFITTPNH